MTFEHAVYRLLRRVPPGHVVTYGQVAALVGYPRRARAVGRALRECPGDVPWHRVVNAQGSISPRRRMSGMLTQRIRLEQEGIRLRGGRVTLRRHRWDPSLTARRVPRPREGGRRCVSR